MKKILFILFSFLIQFGFAQNWELFPYGQKSYFTRSPRDYNIDLFEINQDSIIYSGDDKIMFFSKKSPLSNLQNCYDEVCDYEYLGLEEKEADRYDSIFVRNDTTYFYSEIGTRPFYFLNKSNPGDTWVITNDVAGPDYDSVIMICESAGLDLIFGLTDSVKTYSIHSTGPMAGENIIDGMTLKLSKSYGLLEFLQLSSFLIYSEYLQSYPVFNLTGFKKDEINYGFILPEWKDYFHYQPGDIRKFYFPADSWPPVYTYRMDTIVSAFYSDDSIVYVYNYGEYSTAGPIINYGTDITEKYYRNALKFLLEEGEKWPAFTSYMPVNINANYDSDEIPVSFNNVLKLDSTILEGAVVIDRNYQSNYSRLNVPDCNVDDAVDLGSGFGFNSYWGLTGYCEYFDMGLGYCYSLIGAKIGVVEWGDLSFPNSIAEYMIDKEFLVYPNPATNIIQIDIPTTKSFLYSIFTFDGKIISTSDLTTNQINIENLIPGMYLLELKNEIQTLRGKFIKQ